MPFGGQERSVVPFGVEGRHVPLLGRKGVQCLLGVVSAFWGEGRCTGPFGVMRIVVPFGGREGVCLLGVREGVQYLFEVVRKEYSAF